MAAGGANRRRDNPGNSGGPVLNDNKIVGIVMQGISNADNIGYMIPARWLNVSSKMSAIINKSMAGRP